MIVRTCEWVEQATGGKLVGTPADPHLLIQGVSTDSRKRSEGSLFVPLKGENFDGHRFLKQAIQAGCIASLWKEEVPIPENVTIPFILVEDPLTALQQLASCYRNELDIPIVAVTGSNGKTTTKDLISSVLSSKYRVAKTQGNLNNLIGVPLTILSMPEETEIGVVEMGMNQKGEISQLSKIARPNVAVITNIGESHLEFLGTRAGIAEAKWEITEGLKPDGILIINGDDPILLERISTIEQDVVRIGFGTENDQYPLAIETRGLDGIQFSTNDARFELPLIGRHNVLNALYAIQVGRLFKLSEEEIGQGLKNATVTEMRLQLHRARNKMFMINDAYNASPTSMKAALDLLQEVEPHTEKWVLLGDMLEIGEKEERYHREIGAYAAEKNVKRILTIGERGKWIAEGAAAADQRTKPFIKHFTSHDEAIRYLETEGSQNVLLLVKASKAMHLDQVVQKLL